MKVLITGAQGFIGRNLAENLKMDSSLELLLFDVNDEPQMLERYAAEADFVFHLAGVNRPKDECEFITGNADLTLTLTRLLARAGGKTPLLLSSSVQAVLDNSYGKSKKQAEDAVFKYAQDIGAPVYIYRLPGVFGKWCRPNYNSVAATFCHNAANGLPLRVDDPQKELTLVYIDDIINEFCSALHGKAVKKGQSFYGVQPQYKITLSELASMVQGFASSRDEFTITSDFAEPFVRKMYATWLSHLPEDKFSTEACIKKDERGYFAELIKSPHFGQISVSRTKPGVTRGNHWHNTKVEKFIVIEGEALITFRKIGGKDTIEYSVSEEKIEIVDIPPGYTHAIKNIGQTDLLTIFWAGEIYDKDRPDTQFSGV